MSPAGKILVGADDGLYIYDGTKFGDGTPDEPCSPDVFAASNAPVANVVCAGGTALVVAGDDILAVSIE